MYNNVLNFMIIVCMCFIYVYYVRVYLFIIEDNTYYHLYNIFEIMRVEENIEQSYIIQDIIMFAS